MTVTQPNARVTPEVEPAGDGQQPGPTEPMGDATPTFLPAPSAWQIADAVLLFNADLLDDYERLRIATENRLRTLTSDAVWGKGVADDLPEVKLLRDHLERITALEHAAELAVRRAMRAHPLGPWVKRTIGVGDKQAGRLLAAIGDPSTRPNPAKLWAFCGLHVLPVNHCASDTHSTSDAGDAPDGPRHPDLDARNEHAGRQVHERPDDQVVGDTRNWRVDGTRPTNESAEPIIDSSADIATRTQGVAITTSPASGPGASPIMETTPKMLTGIAPRRRRGQRANWSTQAKTRCYLVAESCIKHRTSPYRAVYDEGRAKYADALDHTGQPLTLGHQHARAMRLVMKRILLDLWREARALREAAE